MHRLPALDPGSIAGLARLVQALGKEWARALLSGREVRLDNGIRMRLASR